MAAYPLGRRDGWRALRLAGTNTGVGGEPQARPAGSIRWPGRRATIDLPLTASAVLVAASELLLTAWLVVAVAAGLCALVALLP